MLEFTLDFLPPCLIDGVEVKEAHAYQNEADGHGGKEHPQCGDHTIIVFAHTRLVTSKTRNEEENDRVIKPERSQ